MNILHLPVNKIWFDMIASGKKKEEYREIKPYWASRLYGKKFGTINLADKFKKFDIVRFKNGYNKNARILDVECLGIDRGYGNKSIGAKLNELYYIIKLGKIIKPFNVDKYCKDRDKHLPKVSHDDQRLHREYEMK